MNLRLVSALSALLLAPMASAAWSGKGEAGVVFASGNTDTESGNANIEVSNEVGDWKHSAGFSALYASNDGVDTAKRWALFGGTERTFNPKTYGLAAFRYEDDEFSGFDSQTSLSLGVGRRFIDDDQTKFNGTAGVGFKVTESSDVRDATGALLVAGERENEAIFRGTLDFERKLTDTTSLINAFIVEGASSNTFAENDLSLKVKVNDRLALALGFVVRHNTDPPLGFGSTDKVTTVNLVYEIK